jgi:hypothetical protein
VTKPCPQKLDRPLSGLRQRVTFLVIVLFVSIGPARAVHAGSLTGPIENEGLQAEVVDLLQMTASTISRPLARINELKQVPDGSGRFFVNDLRGPLYTIKAESITLYLDLSVLRPHMIDSPGLGTGFVSFAFHPDFSNNGHFYTVHTEAVSGGTPNLVPALPSNFTQHSVLTEWTAIDPMAATFSGSARELLRIGAPFNFHNMGEISFDPTLGPSDLDYGLLYIGSGDFGVVHLGDPEQLQRLDTPLGAILRIDPLGAPFTRGNFTYGYAIPTSNPFANDPDPTVLGEIYAYGFRNAHRIAWDLAGTDPGPLVSDIGQSNVEELNRLVAGANYGWPLREGTFSLDPTVDPGTVFPLPEGDTGFTYPVAQYDHDEGFAIAGGSFYRGGPLDPLTGQSVFGDIVSGRVFYADADALLAADDGDSLTTAPVRELNLLSEGQPTSLLEIVADTLGLASLDRVDLRFGTDFEGNLYITTKQDGFVRQLVPVAEPSSGIMMFFGVMGPVALRARRVLVAARS